jgi:hypothetical protein
MGKYDSIFNSEEYAEIQLNEGEGLAAIVAIAALADDPQEMVDPEFFLDTLSYFDLFAESSEEELLEMVDRLIALATEEGMGVLFNAADEAIPDELVPDVYAAAIFARLDPITKEISSDGELFLKELREVLDIDDEEAISIMIDVKQSFAAEED